MSKQRTKTGILYQIIKLLRQFKINELIELLKIIQKIINMWKTSYNSIPDKGQKIMSESQTIQGQTISVAQMLQRINNGMPVDIRQGQYFNEFEPFPKIQDLTDIENVKDEVNYVSGKIAKHKQLKLNLEEKAKNAELKDSNLKKNEGDEGA